MTNIFKMRVMPNIVKVLIIAKNVKIVNLVKIVNIVQIQKKMNSLYLIAWHVRYHPMDELKVGWLQSRDPWFRALFFSGIFQICIVT